jgi:sodium-dependent dicarboxylate transporter 2/3/5
MKQKLALIAGPGLAVLLWCLAVPEGLSAEAWQVAGLAVWMAVWWFSEAIPLPATALLPMVVLPLSQTMGMQQAAAPYAHPVVFLFMGGFIIAQAIQARGLSQRLALWVIRRQQGSPSRTVAAFFITAAVLSLWVNNTATALMLLPIAHEVLRSSGDEKSTAVWAPPLLLALAYGCNIGGMGTIISTAPNALTAAFLGQDLQFPVSFAQWLMFGLPLVVLGVGIGIVLLTRVLFRVPSHGPKPQLSDLPAMSAAERRTAIIAIATALAWMLKPWLKQWIPGIHDTAIAMGGALLLFVIPAGLSTGKAANKTPAGGDAEPSAQAPARLLSWQEAAQLPWGVLILFGGGLSLAAAIQSTGLAQWLGNYLAFLEGVPVWVLVACVVSFILLLTEFTSNTATTAAFLPIIGALATSIGQPHWQLLVPMALAASGAFMMPVATPPNAIVFGGALGIRQMVRAGIWFNLLFVTLITLLSVTLLPWALG